MCYAAQPGRHLAMEQLELLARDLRNFFRSLRRSKRRQPEEGSRILDGLGFRGLDYPESSNDNHPSDCRLAQHRFPWRTEACELRAATVCP